MAPITQWRGHSLGFWFAGMRDVRGRLACYTVLAFTIIPVILYLVGALDYLIGGGQ